jgi:hypothetical protein
MTARLVAILAALTLTACGQSAAPPDAPALPDAQGDASRCSSPCSAVQACCGTEPRCVDYYSDPANCGGCGIVCDPGAVCVGRMCVAT